MKNALIIILLLAFAGFSMAQKPKPADEKAELETAVNAPQNSDKAALLEKFVRDHPKSKLLQSARESLVVARAAYAEELLRSGKGQASYEFFETAVNEAPDPISDKLYDGAIAKFPSVLYWAGQRKSAFEIAKLIETKAAGNAGRLQSLAMFYLSIEDGTKAKTLAEAAITADPESAPTYETLGLANRFNFDFEAAAAAYAKAVEIDAENISAKLSLAEMKRALGKPAEATAIYNEILSAKPDEAAASTGLVMSLFDEDKRDEAETQLAAVTEKDDKNFVLLAGVAYWYAANGEGEKAAELAQKAIDIEPRYIWAHIALGRALIAQNDPVAAEKVLIAARRYANIPTLEYAIAAARYKAGFYREAAEELSKSFEIEDGKLRTLLGRRIEKTSDSFTELVGYERRASIFEPRSSAKPVDDERMKALLAMVHAIDYGEPEATISAATEKFTAGEDKMSLYRRLFAADILLDKNINVPKATELTESTVGKTDDALDVATPSAAVMASELYESRTLASARGEFLVIPTIPKPTLSAILRGRVEMLSGRALFRQNKYEDATIHYRRAISVLPVNSAWWRSAWWLLGESLQSSGSGREALEAYIKSYKSDKPDVVKYSVVEALYVRINGSKRGLVDQIGENPLVATNGEQTNPEQTPEVPQTKEPFIPRGVPVSKEAPISMENTEVSNATAEPVKETSLETKTSAVAEIPQPTRTPVESIETLPTESASAANVAEVPQPSPTPTETVEEIPIAVSASEPQDEPVTEAKESIPSSTSSLELIDTAPKLDGPVSAKTEPKEIKPEEPKPSESAGEKSGFEPVVIVVGKPDKISKPSVEKQKIESSETDVPAGKEPTKESTDETVSENLAETPEPTDPADTEKTGNVRKRIIDGLKINEEVGEKCSIYTSQDSVSILNDGGSLGILVGIDGVESKDIKIANSSPENIGVSLQPDINGIKNRSFFVIRSKSTKTGVYDVTFSGGCGSKIIPVTVR